MPSPDPVWMFNQNSTRYRGVWHIIEGELLEQTVPESRHEYKGHIWRNHTKSCNGVVQREWVQNDSFYFTVKYTVQGCTCKYDTTDYEIILGEYTSIHITPEHTVVREQPVLCHQAWLYGSTLHRVYFDSRKKKQDGDVIVMTDKIVPLHLWTGELPPGPSCSRCYQAWKKQNGAE